MRSFLFHMQSVFLLLSCPVSHILCFNVCCILSLCRWPILHAILVFLLLVLMPCPVIYCLFQFCHCRCSLLHAIQSFCHCPVLQDVLLLHQCMAVIVFLSLSCPALSLPFCVTIKYDCVSVGNFFSIQSRSFLPLCPSPTSVVHYNLHDWISDYVFLSMYNCPFCIWLYASV